MRYLFLFALFLTSLLAQDLPTLGGYFSSVYEKSKTRERFTIDDFALLLYTQHTTTDFLAEFEAKDLYFKQQEPATMERCDIQFNIERLFIRHYLDASQTLQIGKFNTPVGFWNIIPINPLRDTISVVNLSLAYFPKLLTGIMYKKEQSDSSFLIALQENPGIDDGYNNFKVDRHYLVSLTLSNSNITHKYSLGYYETKDDTASWYGAYAFQMEQAKTRITFESVIRREKTETTYDLYLSSLYRFYPKWAAAFRIENFRAHYNRLLYNDTTTTTTLIHRPHPNVALKAEFNYFFQTRNPQWLLSISFMF